MTMDTLDGTINQPGSFGSLAGMEIQFPVGYQHYDNSTCSGGCRLTAAGSFTNKVIVTWADPTRPGALVNFDLLSGNNWDFETLDGTGQANNAGGRLAFLEIGATNTTVNNVHAHFSTALANNGTIDYGFMSINATGVTVTNSSCDYCSGGISGGGSGTVSDSYIRYFWDNCRFFANPIGIKFIDFVCASPQHQQGCTSCVHPDFNQFADGSSPHLMGGTNVMDITADSADTAQGNYFGGGIINVSAYVDDGTGAHGPGNVVTITSASKFSTSSSGAQIYSPGVTGLASTDNVILTCSGGCSATSPAGTISGPAINAGSPASPITLWTYGNNAYAMDGYLYSGPAINGMTTQQEQGTSFIRNFAYWHQNIPAVTPVTGPAFEFQFCDYTALHGGTFDIASGFLSYAFTSRSSTNGTCTPQSPNSTITNVYSAVLNSANAASAYKYGDPEVNLEAISQVAYSAMDVPHLVGTYAHYGMPKSGGPLDLGSGLWAGPFKDDGSGHCVWNNATNKIIPNCTP